MSAAILKLPLVFDLFGFLERRMERHFDLTIEMAEVWALGTKEMTVWEDQYLLDSPTAEALSEHKKAIKKLLRYGGLFAAMTGRPEFPDKKVEAMVGATVRLLQDKLAAWHGEQVSEAEGEAIIKKVFGES